MIKIPVKALRSTKIEEFELIIFEIRINFQRKTAVHVAQLKYTNKLV